MIKQLFDLSLKQILFLALFLRVVWVCLVSVDPVADSVVYDAFAQSIASGNGYAFPAGDITAYWPVGTAAVYGLLYYIFGHSYQAIALFNLVIGMMIVYLTYAITNRYLDQKIARIAALLVAIWPILIEFTTIHASELIFIFLILSALYIWGNKNISPLMRAAIWGALICAATYVRPTALPLLAVLPILQWFNKESVVQCVTAFIVASVTAALLFSPWVYRNYQVFGQFVLVSANGGANLWMGNHEGANGGYAPLPRTDFENEVIRDQYYKKEAINFIKQNPLEYIKLAMKRAYITYKAETIGIVWNGDLYKKLNDQTILILKLVSSLFWWLMLLLAAIGLFKLLKDRELSIFNVIPVTFAFFFVFPLLTVGQDRYHLPVNPFLAMFAAYVIYTWIDNKTRLKS